MKSFSVLIFFAVVAITIEKCRNRYLLVNINDSKEKAKANESDRSTELLKKLKIDKDDERKSGDTRDWELVAEQKECKGHEKYAGSKKTLEECAYSCQRLTYMFIYGTNDFGESKCSSSGCECYCELQSEAGKCDGVPITHKGYRLYRYKSDNTEWLHFLHVKRNKYIGDPLKACFPLLFTCWDGANLKIGSRHTIGKHALCDIDGNSLKLSDIKRGMYVKIRAKNVHWIGYEYLYTADGEYGYTYYDRLQLDHGSDAHKKQTWIVKIDPSDGTFLFESTYWNKGNYFNGNEGYWLYCDRDGSQSWWNLTSAVN